MKFRACVLFVSFLLGASGVHADEIPNVVISRPSGGMTVAMAHFTTGTSYVTDKRTVALAAGRNLVRFQGVPGTLSAESVQPAIAPLDKSLGNVDVLQQRFRPIIKASETEMLKRSVGRQVTVLRADLPPLKGTLLTTEDTVLIETEDGIVINPQGTFIVPRPSGRPDEKESFTTTPMLEWVIDAPNAGQYSFTASYSMAGLGWSADYRTLLAVQPAQTRLNLYGWLTLQNNTGLEFKDAKITLWDGSQLHLPEKLDLPALEEKQVSFLRIKDLPVKSEWIFWPTRGADFFKVVGDLPITRAIQLTNNADNQLNQSIPDGPLTVWDISTEGALKFSGKGQVRGSAPGGGVWIFFDNVTYGGNRVERRLAASRQLSPVTTEQTMEITLPAGPNGMPVSVIESLPYNAKITEAKIGTTDIQPEKLDDRIIRFTVALQPERTTLKYVIEVRN